MSDIPSYTPPPPPPPPPGGSYTPPPPPPPGGAAPGGDRTIMVVLSYLWILALIPLLTKKDDPEVQWHAKNGLAILIGWFVLWFCFMLLMFLPLGPLRLLFTGVRCVITLGFLALIIVCIMKAVNGQRFRIPVISDFADK